MTRFRVTIDRPIVGPGKATSDSVLWQRDPSQVVSVSGQTAVLDIPTSHAENLRTKGPVVSVERVDTGGTSNDQSTSDTPDEMTVYDVNGDGSVDATDVQALATRIQNDNAGPEYDFNGDGSTDMVDVQWLFDNMDAVSADGSPAGSSGDGADEPHQPGGSTGGGSDGGDSSGGDSSDDGDPWNEDQEDVDDTKDAASDDGSGWSSDVASLDAVSPASLVVAVLVFVAVFMWGEADG